MPGYGIGNRLETTPRLRRTEVRQPSLARGDRGVTAKPCHSKPNSERGAPRWERASPRLRRPPGLHSNISRNKTLPPESKRFITVRLRRQGGSRGLLGHGSPRGVFHKLPARREKERRTTADERRTSASLRKQCGLRMRWEPRRATNWPAC